METGTDRALTPARGTLLRVQRSSKLAAGAHIVTAMGIGAVALQLAGRPVSASLTRGIALAALPIAIAMAIRTASAIWRGPALMHFPVEYAVLCRASDAADVRAAASLRGPLGGAGHVHRARLVVPAAAWLLAAVVLGFVAAGAAERPECRQALLWMGVAVAVRALFPPRAFWYREHRDGSVVLYPASVTEHVTLRARRLSKAA